MPTLEQLQEKMKKLQTQADALIAKKAQAAVDQIRKIMLAHGLTTQDIEAKAKAKREAKAATRSASNVKAKVAGSPKSAGSPKYQHPKTGATWTGHGRAPAWIANVRDRTRFLVAGGVDTAHAASVGNVGKAKAVGKKAAAGAGAVGAGTVGQKGQRQGPQPAKYLDPKSGATWSGRGPAPAWLAAAKDRSKFLIAGVGAVAAEVSPARKASKLKSSAASGAVAKKAAAKKAVAKKVSAKKAAPAKKASRRSATAGASAVPAGSGEGATL
jgi:DNA-binding protein H-NS